MFQTFGESLLSTGLWLALGWVQMVSEGKSSAGQMSHKPLEKMTNYGSCCEGPAWEARVTTPWEGLSDEGTCKPRPEGPRASPVESRRALPTEEGKEVED